MSDYFNEREEEQMVGGIVSGSRYSLVTLI
jgi:hypothetical protein